MDESTVTAEARADRPRPRLPVPRARLALPLALLLAACGQPVTPPVVTPTPPVGAAVTPTPPPAKTPTGLLAPAPAGQTLTVLNGYDYPPPTETCPPKGYGHDHCEHQEFGLDLVPSDPHDLLVLAPIDGTIAWDETKSTADNPSPSGCIGILPDTDPTLNLTVCHLSVLRASGHVDTGEVLGLRRATNPWIHLSLNVQYDAKGGQIAEAARTAVPFTGNYAIEGRDFAPQLTSPENLHACETIVSTNVATGDTSLPNPLPSITPADLSACKATRTPTPAPRPKPTSEAARWVKAGSLHLARAEFGTVLLTGGKVLVVGDDNFCTPGGAWDSSVQSELWDPAKKRWTRTPDRSTPRTDGVLVALKDGRAIYAGGEGDYRVRPFLTLGLVSIYDPTADTWSPAAPMLQPRLDAAGALLPDGRVLVVGGNWAVDHVNGGILSTTEIYDPERDRWSKGPALPEARTGAEAVTLVDGRILLVGGFVDTTGVPSGLDAVLYDPVARKWLRTDRIPGPSRRDYALVGLPDGGALIVGGWIAEDSVRSALRLDPQTLRWAKTASMARARAHAVATLLVDGRVLVAGGDKGKTGTAELYDPFSGTWSRTANLPAWRDRGAAVAMPDGTALIIGGSNGIGPPPGYMPWCPEPLNATLRYYPGTL